MIAIVHIITTLVDFRDQKREDIDAESETGLAYQGAYHAEDSQASAYGLSD
jgi:hypothetical protein